MPNVPNNSIDQNCKVLTQDPASIIPDAYEGIVTNAQYVAIKEIVSDYSPLFRERLRAKTGLGTFHGGAAVGLSLSNDVPPSLDDLIRRITHPVLRLKRLQPAIYATLFESQRYEELLFQYIPGAREILKLTDGDARTFHDYIELLSQITHILGKIRLVEILKEIDEDCFGAYFPGTRKISIYWIPIAVFAESIGISIEHLTKVVLIHELAHGYTHVGLDINKKFWNTEAFVKSELMLIEGLAQFYTAVLTKEMSKIDEKNSLHDAYEMLLKHQPPNYHGHVDWIELDPKLISEAIRFSLLEARQRDVPFRYKDFTDLIIGNLKRLRGNA